MKKLWKVAILSALVLLITMAPPQSSGLVFIGFIEEFSLNREKASWPLSTQLMVTLLSGIAVAVLEKRVTAVRMAVVGSVLAWSSLMCSAVVPSVIWMSLTYGILYGAGVGTVLVTMDIIVLPFFDDYRGLSTGILRSAEAASALVFAKLFEYLVNLYGIRGMLLIIGAITIHATVFLLSLETECSHETQQPKTGTTPQSTSKIALLKLREECSISPGNSSTYIEEPSPQSLGLRNVFLWPMLPVIVLSGTVSTYSYGVFAETLIDYSRDKRFSLSQATSILVYSSVANCFGALALPLLADRKLLRRTSFTMSCHILSGLSLLLLPFANSLELLIVVSLSVSMFSTAVITMRTSLVMDYVGLQAISIQFAMIGIVSIPLNLGNPYILGFFRDSRGSYDNLYKMTGGLHLFMGLLFCIIVFLEKSSKKEWTTLK